MVNDPITKIMQDASEVVRYDEVGIPLYIQEGLLSAYPDRRALCHWHEDIEWLYVRSGQINYYINGKRVLLKEGEAIMVNSRQMHYGYSENGQECDFICILCHPKIFTANSVLYQSYITPVLSNPALEYLHLKPENPEDAKALQILPEILRLEYGNPGSQGRLLHGRGRQLHAPALGPVRLGIDSYYLEAVCQDPFQAGGRNVRSAHKDNTHGHPSSLCSFISSSVRYRSMISVYTMPSRWSSSWQKHRAISSSPSTSNSLPSRS